MKERQMMEQSVGHFAGKGNLNVKAMEVEGLSGADVDGEQGQGQNAGEDDDEEMETIEEAFILDCRFGELEDVRQAVADYGVAPCEATPAGLLTAVDDLGNTALMMAASNNHAEIIEFLVATAKEKSADKNRVLLDSMVNAVNKEGRNTALHWAALNGHEKVIELLLAAGADADKFNAFEKKPFDEAQ